MRKSFLSKHLFVSVFSLVVFCSPSINVSAQITNITHAGGSPYATIQAAIDDEATVAGDVITVGEGFYDESQVLINKAVSILGAGLATIDGGRASLVTTGLVRITASGNVTFSGFTLKHAGGPEFPGDGGDEKLNVGIYAQSSIAGVTYTISDNRIVGTNDEVDEQDYGFYSYSGKESLVFTNNVITRTGANNLLLEKHEGPVDVSNNILNAGAYGVDAIFNMTYGGLDITALHKFNNNTINLSTGTGTGNAGGVTIASSFNSAVNGNGKFTNVQITDNNISGLIANRRGITLWNGAAGAGVAGDISDPVVTGNTITGINALTPNCRGIQLINLVSNATITNNAISLVNLCFRGFTFGPGTGIATGTQLSDNSFTDFTQLSWEGISALTATCNWWGTTDHATIAASISGPVNYIPWLTSGVDLGGNPNDGFQPSVPCAACDLIVTITQSNPPTFCQGGAIILTANASAGVTYLWSPGGATTQSINVNSSATYSVTVTESNGCTGSSSIVYVPSNNLTNYTILVTKHAWFELNSYVQSGGAGSTYTGTKNKHKIWVNDISTITGAGTFARAKFIDVEAGSTVSTPIPTASPVVFPAFVNNPTPTLGSNVTVEDNTIMVLGGSLYKDIKVGKNATVTFTAAVVNIHKLTTKDKSKVTFTGTTELRIYDPIDISTKNEFNPSMQSVVVYAKSDVDIDKGTTFNGSIYSLKSIDPIGGSKTGDRITMNGLYLAKKLHSHYVTFNMQSCSVPPVPEVPALFTKSNVEESTIEVASEKIVEVAPAFKVTVYPNPSSADFRIQVKSSSEEPVRIRIFDVTGRIIKVINNAAANSYIKVGIELRQGSYLAEVQQGANRQTIKLLKME